MKRVNWKINPKISFPARYLKPCCSSIHPQQVIITFKTFICLILFLGIYHDFHVTMHNNTVNIVRFCIRIISQVLLRHHLSLEVKLSYFRSWYFNILFNVGLLLLQNKIYYWSGIWKEEGWESRRFMFAFYCILFWKRPPLMFHSSYQNGGKIVSIVKPLVGRRWLRN